MRHRVEIQSPVSVTDPLGGRTIEYVTQATVWGLLEERRGKERYDRGVVQDAYDHILTIRWSDSVQSKSRIKYGLRLFNVRSFTNPDGRKKFLEILLAEGVAI